MSTAKNPLREGLTHVATVSPFVLVIFGAGGDLTRRKLIPAIYNLMLDGLLPREMAIVGFSRGDDTDETFRTMAHDAIEEFSRRPLEKDVWNTLLPMLHFVAADFDDPAAYKKLSALLTKLDREAGTGGNRLFYCATPPSQYPVIASQLGAAGLNHAARDESFVRLVVEKPFGHDTDSAVALNRDLHDVFEERQIYRLDHYLGKETVQNILVFRFANGIFEPVWNRQYIDHVQITVAESIGVGTRGGYYDHAGAARDMLQNHLMQLLALVAMEPPVAFSADAVRDEKVKVLKAIHPFTTREAVAQSVRGQYEAGLVDEKDVPGYLDEVDVAADSRTETFVAARFLVDNWRWAGVAFYLRTGKRLAKRVSEIAIQFQRVPHRFFQSLDMPEIEPNVLTLRIQPDEGISLKFGAKVPGPTIRIQGVNMDFFYGSTFADQSPEAYERLVLDCLHGDSTLFTRHDEVETAWGLVSSLLNAWARETLPIPVYPAGSAGPEEAMALLEREGRRWRRL